MRYFLSFFLFLSAVFGFEMPQVTGVLTNVKDGYGYVANNPNLRIGSAGIVTHAFGNGEKSIIARAVVTEKSGNLAKVRFEVYSNLAQSALPVPGVLPREGDRVILNYLYSRALIVAPNEEVYNQVVNHFSNITFVHPDIAAAHLADIHSPVPSREDFRQICYQNAAGLIFIALNNQGIFADCGSFLPLETIQTGTIAHYQKPFYSHIENIDTYFWEFGGSEINNYDSYYRKLLEQK